MNIQMTNYQRDLIIEALDLHIEKSEDCIKDLREDDELETMQGLQNLVLQYKDIIGLLEE